MPESSSPAHGDIPPDGDGDLEVLLAREPGEVTAGLRPVAEVLSALRAAPAPGELTGEDLAMAGFREMAGRARRRARAAADAPRHTVAFRGPRHRRRRRSGLVPGPRLAAAAALAVVALGGVAAYTGSLPTPIQRLAHEVIAAPPAHHVARHHPPPRPLAREATAPAPGHAGPAAPDGRVRHSVSAGSSASSGTPRSELAGLCRALQHARWPGQNGQNGQPGQNGQDRDAYRALVKAAGDIWRVPAYCSALTGQNTWPWDRRTQQHGHGGSGGQWPFPGGYPGGRGGQRAASRS
ncbi:MAG: hypothetical protein JOY82_19130 [Streptosporangiaceae bacterium]|nr:hypothetical protein [Streptosporangiaceae bacterium]MBV9856599.1 hypothetical protein [Streptosporangiaceae bacterium]